MNKCPKCGGTSGFYTKGEYWHYYHGEGHPDGYDFVSESTTAICLDCGRRTKLTSLFGEKAPVVSRIATEVSRIALGDKMKCLDCGKTIELTNKTFISDCEGEYIVCPSCGGKYDVQTYHLFGEKVGE